MNVAIWGSYEHGNFGDDLMAILFADYLKSLNCCPIVFRLNERIATRYELITTNDLSELFSKSTIGIIGGGGMLVADKSLRRYFSKVAWQFESDYKKLYKAIRGLNIELIPLSIGGNGEYCQNIKLPHYRTKVFSEFVCEGTIRLEGDLPLTKNLNFDAKHIPDVLLSTSNKFPVEKVHNAEIKRIGVNLVGSESVKLAQMLEQLCLSDDCIEIIYINTHLKEYGHTYELTKLNTTSNHISDFCHSDDFMKTFRLLSSLDLLISSKLHLGLAAMTYRTPFISFNGKKKTNSYLNSVSKKKTVYFEGDENEIINKITDGSFFNFSELTDVAIFDELTEKSKGHFEYLTNVIEKKHEITPSS